MVVPSDAAGLDMEGLRARARWGSDRRGLDVCLLCFAVSMVMVVYVVRIKSDRKEGWKYKNIKRLAWG